MLGADHKPHVTRVVEQSLALGDLLSSEPEIQKEKAD